ncbi:hypothetical protein ACFYYB_34585 [Streptomyces sp. NPDC002886]|uniref:hypothetical protein n=1 Tax=Streptomyces sp. NPDC002886 TaxID=3364667 RepID=UPI00367A5658
MTISEAQGPMVPPSYPPRSPPPQKKPVEAPRPQPATKPKAELMPRRPRLQIRNRQTAVLTFRADQWAAAKAGRQALATVRGWGYPALDADDLAAAVNLLVNTVVKDGGKRVSVHLADQEQKVLVLVLGHMPDPGPTENILGSLGALRTVDSWGTDAAEDGRRVWALLDAEPRRLGGTAA